MTGEQFPTSVEEINGGDPIASTLRFQFGNLEKTLSSKDAHWMILHKTDISKIVTTASTWQIAIDLSTITDFADTPQDHRREGSTKCDKIYPWLGGDITGRELSRWIGTINYSAPSKYKLAPCVKLCSNGLGSATLLRRVAE